MTSSDPTWNRRQLLRVATKLMTLVALGFIVSVFVMSLSSTLRPEAVDTMTVEVSELAPGELMVIDWNGRPVIILRRNDAILDKLQLLGDALADPESRHSRQPSAAKNQRRSLRSEFFVAFAYSPDFGCPVKYVDVNETGPSGRIWYGGFQDQCRGYWYDLAGRVYKDQDAWRNLEIPPHQWASETQLILGQN